MSLRNRMFIIIAVPLVAFLILLYLILSNLIQVRFNEIERQEALGAADRVVSALQDKAGELGRLAADWGRWDAASRFVAGENPGFRRELSDETFLTLKINLIAFVDGHGRIVAAKGYDVLRREEVLPPPEFVGEVPADSPVMRGIETPTAGLLRTSDGLMLAGISPMLVNDGKGGARGAVIMARALGPEFLANLREIVRMPFDILPLEGALPVAWQSAAAQIAGGAGYVLQPVSGDVLLAYAGMNDLGGRPAVVVRVMLYRDLVVFGRTSLRSITIFLMTTGVVFILLMQLIMHRLVTKRIGQLSGAAAEIGQTADFSRRVPGTGQDEIGQLAGSVNGMLECLQHANAEIQRVQGVREEFTSIVSHDLRAPLGIIREGVAIVADGVEGPVNDAQKRTLDVVIRNTTRMGRLITNVLDFSRIESGRLQVRLERADMNEVVSEAFVLMRTAAERKGIGYTLFVPDRAISAECDPERLKQVVTNLIDNAIKFTDRGGVEVRLSAGDDTMVIEVADTGPGIRPEDRERIFERFGQAEQPKGSVRGTGLGLTICKHIVERHSGTITVRSQVGKGTTFAVELPIHPPEPSIG